MTWRILEGQRLNATFGFDVSKPGFDVTTANVMQLAFSSDYSIPKLVAKGTISVPPLAGLAGNTMVSGAKQSIGVVYYGRTISPTPFVAAIASAQSWPCPVPGFPTQLSYLNNAWHTYIFEQPPILGPAQSEVIYGGVKTRRTTTTNKDDTEFTFASCRFYQNSYPDRVEFVTNCVNTVSIKYIIMEP